MFSSIGTVPVFSQIKTCREHCIHGPLPKDNVSHKPSLQFTALLWWDVFYDGKKLVIWIGQLYCCPTICGIPVPCSPSAVTLLIRLAMGPHSNSSMQEFDFMLLGGNTHISNLSARESCWDSIGPTLPQTAASNIHIEIGKFCQVFPDILRPQLWFYNIGDVHVAAPTWEREIANQIKC